MTADSEGVPENIQSTPSSEWTSLLLGRASEASTTDEEPDYDFGQMEGTLQVNDSTRPTSPLVVQLQPEGQIQVVTIDDIEEQGSREESSPTSANQ